MYNVTVITANGIQFQKEFDFYKDAVYTAKEISGEDSNALVEIKRDTDQCLCWSSDDGEEIKRYTELTDEEYLNLTPNFKEQSDKGSIYFDMDGTVAFWHPDGKGFRYPDEVLDPKNHYYRDLEPHPFMIDLARILVDEGYDVCIMSAADKNVIRDKYEWIKIHMPFVYEKNICFCPIGADKNNYVKGNADKSILIDDYNVNLKQWRGIPIKAINTINSINPSMSYIDGNYAEQQIGTEFEESAWEYTTDRAKAIIAEAIGSFDREQSLTRDNTLSLPHETELIKSGKETKKAHNDYGRLL